MRGQSNVRAVRELFRAAHTLKGVSTMVEIDPLVAILGRRASDEEVENFGGANLKQVEFGVAVAELCRNLGVSEQTFYTWKKKYGGRSVRPKRQLS